jgi:putative MFS transporter
MLAIILPYAAESFPLHIRGRATGWIAACTKAGGLAAQALSIAAMVPPLGVAAGAVMVPALLAVVLTWRYCRETLGVDLRQVDRPLPTG